MGSIAKKFVSRSLMLVLFLSLGYLALPVSPAAQNYPQAVILEQKVRKPLVLWNNGKRTRRGPRSRQKPKDVWPENLRCSWSRLRHSTQMIEQWQKAHSSELKTKAREGVHKKRFHCRSCL